MRREKSVPAARRAIRHSRGIALLAFLAALVAVGLAFFIGNLTPQVMEARRVQRTEEALAQAREALIGHALRYRDDQAAQGQANRMYGYLPLPDLGHNPSDWTDRNNNPGCKAEGCDAANFSGNALNTTVIGRLPWRTLGIEPLRDGNGECLWYAVSGSHQRQQLTSPMNWDTLAHLDVVVANGSASLAAVLASAHERPVAVIFSPGTSLPGQNRGTDATYDVTQCGGNYDARNYLDPHTAAALGGISNYLAGTNNASAVTDADAGRKALTTQGRVFASGGNFLPNACDGAGCTLVANDIGLLLTGDQLFSAIRKNTYFRNDINALLDRMVNCLRDQPPASGTAARIPNDACYDASQAPLGYYDHYKDLVFLARPTAAFSVNGDNTCAGALIFAGQRGGAQQRATVAQQADFANYLEGTNLANFSAAGAAFTGDILFDRAPPQAPEQDIVRCIPGSTTFKTVESPKLAELGLGQLVAYDTGLRRLILGRNDLTTADADAHYLFGCAWLNDARPLSGGLRVYFRFQFRDIDDSPGSSVGLNGFTFAVADADPARNNLNACGAGGSHLGYSGNNGITSKINYPKIGIEFDQSRNSSFSESDIGSANPGRNDPDYTVTYGHNSHVAILYWGHETATTDPGPPIYIITQPDSDDNVHGFPSAAFLAAGTPPLPPRNPDVSPGIAFKNLRQQASEGGNSFIYHVRIELTPTGRTYNADARLSHTAFRTEAWIDSSPSADQLNALKNVSRPMSVLTPPYPATLSDTAIMHDVSSGLSCEFNPCPPGQACGSDNMCYRPALQTVQLGFTNSQRTTDQEIYIDDFFATWLP